MCLAVRTHLYSIKQGISVCVKNMFFTIKSTAKRREQSDASHRDVYALDSKSASAERATSTVGCSPVFRVAS